MAHDKETKNERIPVTLDPKSFKEFKQYADDLGIGYCTLANFGIYLLLGIIKSVDEGIQEEYNKPLKDKIPRFQCWPENMYFKPMKIIFKDYEFIPKEVRDEIFSMLLEHINKCGKKNGVKND
jgi:hypothetical protein